MTNQIDDIDIKELAIEILAAQDEPANTKLKPANYWLEKLQSGYPFSIEDRRLLVVSPNNRKKLAEAKKQYEAAFIQQFASNDNHIKLRAAASTQRSIRHFEGSRNFDLAILPSGRKDWMIQFSFICQHFPEDIFVEIKDDQGRIWLSDTPDQDGIILARWRYEDDPIISTDRLSILMNGIKVQSSD